MFKQVSIVLCLAIFSVTIVESSPIERSEKSLGDLINQIITVDTNEITIHTASSGVVYKQIIEDLAEFKDKLERSKRDTSEVQKSYRQQVLAAINYYRSQHCAELIEFDDDLNQKAQKHAENVAVIEQAVIDGRNQMIPQSVLEIIKPTGIYDVKGELFFSYNYQQFISISCLGNIPVDTFYRYNAHYNYNAPSFNTFSHNFINMISRATTHVGAGIAYNREHKKAYMVLFYRSLSTTSRNIREDVLPNTC